MKKYKYTKNGKVSFINVSDEKLEAFLKLHPDATLAEESGEQDFQNGAAVTDASATPPNNQASNTDSKSIDGLLGLEKINNIRKKVFGMTDDLISLQDQVSDEDIKGVTDYIENEEKIVADRALAKQQASSIYSNTLKSEELNDYGTIDYSNKETVANFKNKATTNFIKDNKEIQKTILPAVEKSIKPQLEQYILETKAGYELNDPNTITQEKIDLFNEDVQQYYSTLLNQGMSNNPEFKRLLTDFNTDFAEQLGAGQNKFIRGENSYEWVRDLEEFGKGASMTPGYGVNGMGGTVIGWATKIPGIFIRGGKLAKTAAEKAALGLTADLEAERMRSFERNSILAKENGWTDDTPGYFEENETNLKGSMKFSAKNLSDLGFATYELDGKEYNQRQIRAAAKRAGLELQDYISKMETERGLIVTKKEGTSGNYNNRKLSTWGEFKKRFDTVGAERLDKMNTRAIEILEADIVAAAFDDKSFDKLMDGVAMVENTGNLVIEQLPNMLGAVLTMGALPALQAASNIYFDGIQNRARENREALAKSNGITLSEEELYAPVSPQEMIDALKDETFSKNMAAKAAAGGFVSGQLERIGAAKAFKPFVTKGVSSILRGGIKRALINTGKGVGNMSKGGFSEMLTEIGQELIQASASGNEIDTEGMFKAGASGFIVGAVLPGVGNLKNQSIAEIKTIANVIAGRLNPKSSEAYFNKQLQAIDSLIKQEKDSGRSVYDLEAKRDAILNVRNANKKIPGDFSEASKKRSLDLLAEKEIIENDIEGKDKNLIERELKRIDAIDANLEAIAATENITRKVLKINSKKGNGLGIKIIEAENDAEAEAEAKANGLDIGTDKNTTGYASKDGSTFIINMERASKLGEVNTAAHEMLHQVLFKTLYNVDNNGNLSGKNVVQGLAGALEVELNKLDPSIMKNEALAKRIALYQSEGKTVKAEEVLTLFADALFYGDIEYNDSMMTKLKDFVRRVLQNAGLKDIEFNSGKDVYNFLKDYNRGVARGNLGKGITAVAKEGAKVGSDIKRMQDVVPTAAKANKSVSTLAKVKQTFSDIENDFKSRRSQDKIARELFGMVEAQVSNRFNLSKDKKEELISDTIARIYAASETTKWGTDPKTGKEMDSKGDLYGFLNGRIAKRILDAVRKDPSYLENIDNNQFDALEKAAGVFAEETVVKAEVKPDYRPIIASRVISTEALINIKNKVLSTVRTLKSVIDSNVSINKTVSPLISEIKKEMGKQADIDLKKEMGGKKDNQLEKFLLKGKKAILQNMTTTWLMTAMPGAVQKKVNGSWTNDWKGKKIDRESVKSNNAGRTSGADLVRRSPAVASMSDAEFLGYILDSKGNPIRGRKESLAKAMAEEISLEVFNQQLQDENTDISKAFEQNQNLKGIILAENYIDEVARQSERGNVKFNKSLNESEVRIFKEGSKGLLKTILGANVKLTKSTLTNLMVDHYGETISADKLKSFSGEIIQVVQRYTKEIDKTKNVDFNTFAFEGMSLKESNSNLYKAFGFTSKILGSLAGLFNSDNVARQRGLSYDFNTKIVEEQGVDGLIKIIKWLGGHQTSAGKVGDGRNQIYSGNLDYINNNLKNIPGVEIVEYTGDPGRSKETGEVISKGKTTIVKVSYKGVEIENLKSKLTTPPQSSGNNTEKSKAKFREDYQLREDAAREAWDVLNEFLSFVKDNGNEIDWIMTMMSLKSGMTTILKAAAPVKYYYTGSYTGPLRYEHMIPTEYMVLKLTDYYYNGKSFDLNTLRDKYNVAIIPVKMDDNFNVQRQSQMNPNWDPMTDPESNRYFDEGTYGYPNMYAIEVLGGDGKGNVIGKDWVAFNNTLVPQAASNTKKNIALDRAMNSSRANSFNANPKKIRVFDFDDTLARTKSNVLYTMPGEVAIYHGGSISSIKNITGSFAYFSQDQSQASEYAKGNDGEVKGFVLNESDIASEEDVFKVIRELGIQPKEKGWTVSDSRLYELIDDRFEQSFSKSDLSKLTKALANKGIKASRFTDSDLKSGKDTDNIVVFDKKSIKEQAKIDAATFAKDAVKMEADGAVWDFSEFSKVMNGKKGPLFEVAKIIGDKSGTKDLFVLTARPQDAAGPIQEFLSELGLDIPLENITGLGNGTPAAKADWVVNKINDGYNDFYFADDHTGNVKAVKDILSVLDVKSKVQLAKVKFNKTLSPEFNRMMERTKGVSEFKEFSKKVAERRGADIGKYKFLVSSADDFRGLTSYTFAGKGKQGEADQQFFEDALLTPYFQGVNAVESERQTVKNDFRALSKTFKATVKKLGKLTPDKDFTYDQAVRVYLWNRQGIEVPGLSKRDQAKLSELVAADSDLVAFADAALLSSKKDEWIEPGEYWNTKTMLSDLNDITEKINRKEYLAEFITNIDIIFSEANLNKVEALYGTRHREALEDSIYSMKNGTNRPSGSNKITNRWNNWVNNSIGAIMFFNRRSAVMQLLSTVNFINWSDNNPVKAGLAFANQPQYWKDFAMIFNSDKLKQRRGGLKSDVQEAEIANAAKGSKNKATAILSYLLKIGFTPTQVADSFAISMGGASMYRNRVKTYEKQGFDKKSAEEKAWLDFTKLSDETQQSGDPALVSQQQRSTAGRLILSFQNTTMQYTRLMKKAGQDLVNGRGDAKTNISKIIYYGAVQNFIFNALSNALFALIPGFEDEEEEDDEAKQRKEDDKSSRILHGMMDSLLRGTGIRGAVITTIKNTIRQYFRQEEKGFTANHAYTIVEAANLSPAIGSKLRKINTAIQTKKFENDVIQKRGFDITIDGKFNLSPTYNIIGSLAAASLNIPLDRAISEAQAVSEALDNRNSKWQRVALSMGWRTWDVGALNEEHDLIKIEAKAERKIQGKIKAKETRANNKEEERQLIKALEYSEYKKFKAATKGMSITKRIKWLKKNK